MKDLKKRLVALVVCLCLALSLMPASALAYIGAMDYLDLSADTYADNDFIYLENSSLRFMIERDYGHGMLLWTSDEVVGWGQGVQEMRFTIQYPDQEEREMNVTRLEQRYGQGTIWLIYHFGNDHYQTPGDVEITYEAEITLVPLDSGAATGRTGQYINYNADGKNNWGVLIKGEFEYDSDSVTFDLGGELDQVGATARVRTTFEGFPNMGHETYQNQEAPVSVMLSSYTYDDNYYNYGRIHTATNISRGLGMTSTYDNSDYGGITEIYTSGYAWASPFIATSNFYYQDTGYSYETSEENPKGIAGYPDRNENLGVDDPIYDQRDKRGRSLNLPSYVSYSPGNTSGECVVTTVSEATMLGYKSGDGVTVYDSDMASLLYGYRNLVNMDTMPTRPSDRDDVNVSADADRLAIWYEGDTVRVEPVLGESEVPDNAVAVLRGTFEETDDGAGYRFINGVAALSPTVTATWTGYEASDWALIVYKSGTISVDGYVDLNAPSFKFYQASDTSNEANNLKLEITKDGIKMTMTPSNNSAVPYVDIPNTKVALESGIIKRDGSLEFSGKLSFNHFFFANSALDMTRLAYGYNGSQFTIFGVEATGNIQKTELAGLELGSVSGDINTFNDNNTFDFNAELDVFSLFKAQAVLNFSRMDNGELMPDDIYFNVDSKVGIPITPPAPLAKLKGGGAGIYNLATTINGDWYAIPPILLRGTVDTEIINLLTGTADATIGPSQIELVGRDIKIKALGNLKVIEEVGVGVYLGAQTITNDNISYTGGSFNGEIWLKAGLPSVSMNFIKMDNALSLGVFGGVSSNPMQALLRVTGNAKSDVEIQFPDSWPVIGGWNLLGAELNAAAGAQTVVPFTGSVGSIFEESFNNLDIYLGVAATASLLGSDIPNVPASLTVDETSSIVLTDNVNKDGEDTNYVYLTNTAELDNRGEITDVVMQEAKAGSYRVVYMVNGQTYHVVNVEYKTEDGVTTITYAEPADPEVDGYRFNGWDYGDDVSVEDGQVTITIGENAPDDGIYTFEADMTRRNSGSAGGDASKPSIRPDTDDDDSDRPSTSTGLPFDDVDTGDWYYEAVEYVYENGLMNGVASDEFSPNATLTRGMMVTILYRLEGEPAVNYALPFDDIDGDEWYAEAVRWAASEGIVNGVSDTEYAPNANITREQLATMLYRYAQYIGMDAVDLRENISGFADADSVSEYAVQALNWAVGEELVNGMGDNTLAPQGNATRAQAAALLMRYVEYVA